MSIGKHVNGKDLIVELRCATWADNSYFMEQNWTRS